MYIVDRSVRFIRGALMSYGPSFLKRSLWDQEYSTSKWNFNDNTTSDIVYGYLEKWAKKGAIMDLGCGSGNTSNEIAESAYGQYLGVDISEVALAKARKRTQENGRTAKNQFVQGELLGFSPPQKFDVILFRESMYHVPLNKVKSVLEHYADYLKPEGVFIVRMSKTQDGKEKWRPTAMFRVIEKEFDVVEEGECSVGFGGTVMVFRPKSPHPIKAS